MLVIAIGITLTKTGEREEDTIGCKTQLLIHNRLFDLRLYPQIFNELDL